MSDESESAFLNFTLSVPNYKNPAENRLNEWLLFSNKVRSWALLSVFSHSSKACYNIIEAECYIWINVTKKVLCFCYKIKSVVRRIRFGA